MIFLEDIAFVLELVEVQVVVGRTELDYLSFYVTGKVYTYRDDSLMSLNRSHCTTSECCIISSFLLVFGLHLIEYFLRFEYVPEYHCPI